MKTNIKYLLTIVITLIFGLLIGYLLFNSSETSQKDQQEQVSDMETIYTCSMHPQIRQNEPGLCPICEMELIPVDQSSSSGDIQLEMTEAAMQLANVQTTVLGSTASSGKELILNGKIQVDESRDASLVAHIPGRIEKLHVNFTNEQVSKGQRIATIYSPDLITAQRELIEAKKIQELSPRLLAAARNKLRFWKIPEQLIAEIEQTESIRETFGVFAGQSGIVKNKKVSVGDYVQQGQILFEIQNLNNVWVLFEAYEDQLPQVSIGDEVTFTTSAFPDSEFKTTITFIDPIIHPTTRVAMLRAEINNSRGDLKPEMFVQGVIQPKKRTNQTNQLLVPVTAVLWTGAKSVVYVKNSELDVPTFEYREITLGDQVGDRYIVLAGLQDGDAVVTNGAFSIDAAAQLNNQRSMMNARVITKKQSEIASQKEQFKVSGNCSMCKERVETTVKKLSGVSFADWNIETKMLNVHFEEENISVDQIKQRIAEVGHDTDQFKATDEAYARLAKCCQYERDSIFQD